MIMYFSQNVSSLPANFAGSDLSERMISKSFSSTMLSKTLWNWKFRRKIFKIIGQNFYFKKFYSPEILSFESSREPRIFPVCRLALSGFRNTCPEYLIKFLVN